MKNSLRVMALTLASLFFLTACSSPQTPVNQPVGSGKTVTYDVTAKQFEFVPSLITANKGDTVIINIKSADVTHGFAIREYGINETIDPGKTKQVKFIADKTGTFEFFCTVPCGPGHQDMNGKMVISE